MLNDSDAGIILEMNRMRSNLELLPGARRRTAGGEATTLPKSYTDQRERGKIPLNSARAWRRTLASAPESPVESSEPSQLRANLVINDWPPLVEAAIK